MRLLNRRSPRWKWGSNSCSAQTGQPERRAGSASQICSDLPHPPGSARRFGSICTGAFLLGAAGLLDGRRVTTHWASCADLARFHPTASVEVDPIFIREGRFFSSAGITAGIDLALSLVEEDHGRDFALNIARYLVLYLKRAGGQAQFSVRLQAQFSDVPAIERVQHWCEEKLDSDLPAGVLCQVAGMSERSFIRKFRQETGQTVGEYVATVRLEAACRLLTETGLLLKEVARKCGFGSVAALRRAFVSRIGVPPRQYRKNFQVSEGADRFTRDRGTADATPGVPPHLLADRLRRLEVGG